MHQDCAAFDRFRLRPEFLLFYHKKCFAVYDAGGRFHTLEPHSWAYYLVQFAERIACSEDIFVKFDGLRGDFVNEIRRLHVHLSSQNPLRYYTVIIRTYSECANIHCPQVRRDRLRNFKLNLF